MTELWPRISVGSLVEAGEASLQTGPFGTQLSAAEYVLEGIPVINVRNVGFGDVRADDLEYVSEGKAEQLHHHVLRTGDIVFGRKGAVERHALIGAGQDGWVQGSDCLRLRLRSSRFSVRFVSFYLRTKGHQDWMQALCSFGATMSSLNQDIVNRIQLPCPPRPVQDKIAAVLAAYDDMIANNQRRIALLESMAEEIYREWFVRMRFPGYETAAHEKGMPLGWQASTAAAMVHVQGGGTPSTEVSQYWDGEIPFFSPKDSHDGAYCLQTEQRITELGLENCASRLFPKDTIFITARGTVGNLVLAGEPMAMNQSCYALVPKIDKEPYFFFTGLKCAVDVIKGVSNSGVFDNVVMDTFKIIPLINPGDALRERYNEVARSIYEQSLMLRRSNMHLRATRDALLPRLISGKLRVDALDIQFPPSMQPPSEETTQATSIEQGLVHSGA